MTDTPKRGKHFAPIESQRDDRTVSEGAGSTRCPIVSTILIGFPFAIATVLGYGIDAFGDSHFSSPLTWAIIAGIAIPACIVLLLLRRLFAWIRAVYAERPVIPVEDAAHDWFLYAVAIFACYIPMFLIFFPGIMGYDTGHQINQLLGTDVLNTHHPVLHTLLITALFKGSFDLFGTSTWGAAAYSLGQMLLCAVGFGWVSSEVGRLTRSRGTGWAAVAWFGLNPINSILAVSCTKDPIFSVAFAILFCLLIRVLVEDGELGWKDEAKLFGAALFALLFRNNMLHALVVFILLVLVAALAMHGSAGSAIRIRSMLVPLIAAGAVYLVIVGPVYTAAGVDRSTDEREMLSVPLQALARTATVGDGVLSEEQLEFIETLIPDYQRYKPGLSDSVKRTLDREYLLENPQHCLDMYLAIGWENPRIYVEAFLQNTHLAWYPGAKGGRFQGWNYHPYLETTNTEWRFEGVEEYYVPTQSLIPVAYRLAHRAVRACVWERIPVLAQLMCSGLPLW
ncbi:MAG: hypothetical protein IJH87_04255, partial [Atopobiaceae bacterium]|nr:hypothetical protein [Atopobiaceae bacterium]